LVENSTNFDYNEFMKKKIIFFIILGVFLVATAVSLCCIFFIKKDNTSTLKINCEDSIVIELNETYTPKIFCSEDATITFTSSNENVVEIINNNFIGLSEGSATVRVTAKTEHKSTNKNISITVRKTITNLNISLNESTTLYLLDKKVSEANTDGYFSYTTFTSDYDFTYTKSNDNVNVKNGKITAVSEGETEIIFTSTSQPNISSTHRIIVKKFNPILSMTESKIAIKNGDSKTLNFSLIPSYYYGAGELTYNIKDDSIVSIKKSTSTSIEFEGKKLGNTYIEFYLNGSLVKTVVLVVNSTGKINNKIYHYELISGNNTQVVDDYILVTGSDPTFSINILDEDNNIGTDIGNCTYDTNKITALLGGNYYIDITVEDNVTITYSDIKLTINILIKFE